MARTHDPTIRAALRERALDYVLAHGLTDLSLRPLAKALGTHARMLVYHFGSREGLMRDVLTGLRAREDARVDAWFRASKRPPTILAFVRWYWRRMGSPEARPAAVLVFELYALALRNPEQYPGVLTSPLAYWNRLVKRAGARSRRGSSVTATLLLAATRGLLLDAAATGDHRRVNRALSRLLALIDGRP
jgi:AcrR family transcriptional regulator